MISDLGLCQVFINSHPGDAARVLERLGDAQAAALLEEMPATVTARVLGAMVPTLAAECLQRLAPETAAAALVELSAGYAVVLLRRLDPHRTTAILAMTPVREAGLLSTILAYPPDCAGSMMDSRVFAASESLRVGETLAALRRVHSQLYDDVFVVDPEHRLVGVVRVRDLLSARRKEPLTTVMSRAVSRLSASAPRVAVLNHPGWRQSHILPVVDAGNVLIGAIAHGTARAIFEEDALRRPARAEAVTTAFALGELYWLGLSSVLDGLASAVRRLGTAPGGESEVNRGSH
ncbi:MAG: CBS domain-containing protein [Vicinamibacterales bacterium]